MNSIELFAGIGGLGMGVARAGFKQVLAVEKNIECCKTIAENQNSGVNDLIEWNVLNDDIKNIDFKKYENKIALVTGGPPCQPFSLGGKHLGNLDVRDSFPETVRAIKEIKPKAFIFENVRGLTRKTFANYFEYIILQLTNPELTIKKNESFAQHLARLEGAHTKGRSSGLSYNIVYHILNAADFGLPQIRQRVFIVGFRSDTEVSWHFPKPTHSCEELYRSMANGSYWDRHRISIKEREKVIDAGQATLFKDEKVESLPWLTLRDAICDLPDPEKFPQEASAIINHTFQPGARSYKGHSGSLLDQPSKTLKAGSHGVPGGENAIRNANGSLRYLTVRESARLQGFPDNYVFKGSWGQAMNQLGNAVPVPLAEILGKSVLEAITTPPVQASRHSR
ncbi:MAG TPA: DNA cytosine methyltransferase [Hanamia sp.]